MPPADDDPPTLPSFPLWGEGAEAGLAVGVGFCHRSFRSYGSKPLSHLTRAFCGDLMSSREV